MPSEFHEAEARRAFPGAVFIRAEPGSPMARGAGNLASRVFASLYHNWYLQDLVVLRADLPALDLLRGGVTDLSGGRPCHEVEFQAGIFKRGLGARISATWQSGTIVQGSGTAGGELRFAGLATVDLNLFANLAERLSGSTARPWLRGTRASLASGTCSTPACSPRQHGRGPVELPACLSRSTRQAGEPQSQKSVLRRGLIIKRKGEARNALARPSG